MSNGQNTAAAAAAISAASQVAAGQPLSIGTVVPVAEAILAATGHAATIGSPQTALALALAQAAIEAHQQITAGNVEAAWVQMQARVQAAQAEWQAAGAA